jgi:hypothetical protein
MRSLIVASALAIALTGCRQTEDPAKPPTTTGAPARPVDEPAADDGPQPSKIELGTNLESFVRALPQALGGLHDVSELAPELAAIDGIESHTVGKEGYANTIFIEPMDAERVATLLGLTDPHVVSTVVHQTSWSIVARTGADWTDDYGHRRIAADAPQYGEWELRISVDGRPPGPLPGLSWGPSPAYPLAGSGVKVKAFTIDRRQ